MTPYELLAVAKAVKSKDAKSARSGMEPGSYAVDTTVRIAGNLEVAEDGERTSTSSLLSEEFLVLVLKISGCTRKRAAEVIKTVSSEYLQGWTGSKEDKKASKLARKEMIEEYDPNGEISEIIESVKESLPKTRVKGSVKFAGEVEVVSEEAGVPSISIAPKMAIVVE